MPAVIKSTDMAVKTYTFLRNSACFDFFSSMLIKDFFEIFNDMGGMVSFFPKNWKFVFKTSHGMQSSYLQELFLFLEVKEELALYLEVKCSDLLDWKFWFHIQIRKKGIL